MILSGTRWFLPNGSLVAEGSQDGPYYESSAPGTLVIMSAFSSSYAGTYTCSPSAVFPTIPPGVNITLISRSGEYITYVCSYIIIYIAVISASYTCYSNKPPKVKSMNFVLT